MDDLELVVFDMAGTTIEDTGQVPAAFTTVLQRYHVAVTAEAVRAVRGASKREAIRRLVAQTPSVPPATVETLADEIFDAFRGHLIQTYTAQGLRAIPGAASTLAWLQARGVKIALSTGFDRVITDVILAAVGWNAHTIAAVVCGDDVTQGRPAPYLIFRAMEATHTINVARVMTVGDTVLDLEAGHNAGVRWNVGVLSGAHTRAQLEEAPHTHLLPSVAALPELW